MREYPDSHTLPTMVHWCAISSALSRCGGQQLVLESQSSLAAPIYPGGSLSH